MRNIKLIVATALFFLSFLSYAQPNAGQGKLKVTGKVIEKSTNLPLEYSTITLKNVANPNQVFGGITDAKGEFSVDVASGNYNIIIEFISFQANEINNKSITQNTNLGTILLEDGAKQLNEVVVRAEKTTVEIKLNSMAKIHFHSRFVSQKFVK